MTLTPRPMVPGPSRAVRAAIRIYAVALRFAANHVPAERRSDMLRTFIDGRVAAEHRGSAWHVFTGVVPEVGNVFLEDLRRRAGRTRSVTTVPTSSAAPDTRRDWAIGTDIRHGVRRLWASAGDSLLVVALLALGVATSSVIFGVADALLLRPAPFPDASRLVQVWSKSSATRFLTPSMPIDLVPMWLSRTDLFSTGGAYVSATAMVTDHGEPELIPAAQLSPGLLETLGVAPALGRTFRSGEGEPGRDRIVILSDDVWTSRFGRTPSVVGQSMQINGAPYEIVGVMPPRFQYPFAAQRLWMPLGLSSPAGAPPRWVTLTARMRPGLTRDALRQQVEAAGPSINAHSARAWKSGSTVQFGDTSRASDAIRQSIELLAGATVLLLLMVGLSAANLGLARVLARTRDAAIRSALGASRTRLLRQAFVEDAIVGVCALLLAWPLTVAGLRAARAALPSQFTMMTLHVVNADPRVAGVVALLAILTPILAGLIPALAGSRASVLDVLRLESRSTTSGGRSRWLRDGLVVVEVACAVVLLVSSALLGRSFLRLQNADLGFDSRNLISVNLGFPRAVFPSSLSRDLYLNRVLSTIRQMPGVSGATAATGVPPIDGLVSFGALLVEGQSAARNDMILSGYEVQPDFFSTVGLPLQAGRTFRADDDRSHVIIGDSLAKILWPGTSAVGKRFKWDDDPRTWMEVIGVARTLHADPQTPLPMPQIYLPLTHDTPGSPVPWQTAGPIGGYMRIAIRASDPTRAIPAIRDVLRSAESTILIHDIERVDDELARDLDRPRFLLALMVVFAAAGLLLAGAAVYAVLSCAVAQGMREIGVRLMLGADPAAIGRTVLQSGLATVGVGLAIGVAVAAAVARVIGSLLFDINAHDAGSYAGVVCVIFTAGLVAAWVPARRAMRADPLTLLRND
jgi:putative ABC transport system permease protein